MIIVIVWMKVDDWGDGTADTDWDITMLYSYPLSVYLSMYSSLRIPIYSIIIIIIIISWTGVWSISCCIHPIDFDCMNKDRSYILLTVPLSLMVTIRLTMMMMIMMLIVVISSVVVHLMVSSLTRFMIIKQAVVMAVISWREVVVVITLAVVVVVVMASIVVVEVVVVVSMLWLVVVEWTVEVVSMAVCTMKKVIFLTQKELNQRQSIWM